MRVNRGTSLVARVPAVRRALVDKQRQIGRDLGGRGVGGLVADGRDQGSVVFPDADFKFLIRAALEKRAERRFQEMTAGAGDDPIVFEEILANLRERDATDAVQWAPLEATGEAVEIDTTAMSVDDVVERMLESITAPQVP
jgi:cytidylate kinase